MEQRQMAWINNMKICVITTNNKEKKKSDRKREK